MIGCYDFCGHYEWTFRWLEDQAGDEAVQDYWNEAIGHDSQIHARDLIVAEGTEGMRKYWQHTLEEEAAGYTFDITSQSARLDMHDCPSKGFLLRNGLHQHSDYCDHCIGWIGPIMRDAGFLVDHEHNHCGQCWWEFRPAGETPPPPMNASQVTDDVRLHPGWQNLAKPHDIFLRASSARDKQPPSSSAR